MSSFEQAVKPGLIVTIASAALRPDHVLLAIRAGANDVVAKPFEIPAIMSRLATGPADVRQSRTTATLDENENAHIARVFAECGGNISQTARWLGITRQRLVRKLDACYPTP